MATRVNPHPLSTRSGDWLASRFAEVRGLTGALAAPLSDADATAQSMTDASPAKWHLAHVTWFFETFVLRDHVEGYELFDADWPFLFNSYYEAEGERHARPRRGMITRPSLDEVLAYRRHVDTALAAALPGLGERARELTELGLHHEQQHQELLLMDIQHLFAENPLEPAMFDAASASPGEAPGAIQWIEGRVGETAIGSNGLRDGPENGGAFAFDCEGPVHKIYLNPHALADRLITNGEWIEFIEAGGYRSHENWLMEGWDWIQKNRIEAPLYWRKEPNGRWYRFGLAGKQPIDLSAPVCHISYYEADAYANWTGFRLPTEGEWENAARDLDPAGGNQLDGAGEVRPRPASASGDGLKQMFGDCWEWTASAYLPHPGFRTAEGAVGEYNGKFMVGQYVLKGACCATPRGHSRASYRNFFYPHMRWQFAGLRLARDL
ncbi:ergothioneine biosynthesis protein EgtB [Parasphingopyxis marina]|uniref:Ergothioneine biosynthesis protein EgtB n=1 Tax=Parasphingopyxis marina TaxID=2761622 RepID=A0A842HUR5_9SPHN|nr:ergothioneine biosynthesis protein EgtB [Parasphingopyxis marina]MBC2776167.1 ergothioneine biosynthesis protein EgtB [Parasphingopyxis marina]